MQQWLCLQSSEHWISCFIIPLALGYCRTKVSRAVTEPKLIIVPPALRHCKTIVLRAIAEPKLIALLAFWTMEIWSRLRNSEHWISYSIVLLTFWTMETWSCFQSLEHRRSYSIVPLTLGHYKVSKVKRLGHPDNHYTAICRDSENLQSQELLQSQSSLFFLLSGQCKHNYTSRF